MHGRTLPRWLKGKGMRENLKGKVEVASRQKTRGLGPIVLLVRSVGLGQGMKLCGYPGRYRATGKKGEGERGLGRDLPILSLCTLERLEKERGRSPAPMGSAEVRECC